ncbi:threonine ammonia-lyase [Sulfobacillus harzensis]|uniref:threonine ammonia-lyase n=1 Tax=Sulfobacillus harzensis TaxID=2729629 RepID=A0A7Y0Q5D9_9FIRM|nr:threonine/serine dehydratase [Sulfobacillus harzensis]NMP24199.1 threonine/serine dehydratase [Sulfobacillus harzensis]
MHIELKDVLAARQRIAPHVHRTPLVYSPVLSEVLAAEVWLKPEQFQLTGSFKVRGALNKMMRLSADERSRGVITASAGNHALGVAWAAERLAVSALVVTPRTTPSAKLAGIRRYGCAIQQVGENYDEAEEHAYRLAEETGRVFLHAFEDADIVAGQGTVGWELFEDQPNLDAILVPAGGGGLMDGIGVVARAVSPNTRVIGVQSKASPAWHAAFQAGRVVDVSYAPTWAEGLLGAIGRQNFVLAQRVVDDIHLVSEEAIRDAMLWALKEHRWILEGSGAVALADALISGAAGWRGQRVAVVLTGGNLDFSRLAEIVEMG